ncbi:MAG: hypothetical protein AAGH99_01890 [Planctomycetota bacterium]
MSEETPPPHTAGGESDQPRKRRRRRRRGKNKPVTGEPANKNPQAKTERESNGEGRPRDTKAGKDRPPKSGKGYRGKNTKAPNGQRTEGNSRSSSASGQPTGNSKPNGHQGPNRSVGAAAQESKGPKKKKRRKPRTKQCVHCYMPCTTIHRVRLDHRKQWVFICDLCWPTRCVDNPHYEFGGTWVTGRIVKPESQIRDEKLAKHKSKPQASLQERHETKSTGKNDTDDNSQTISADTEASVQPNAPAAGNHNASDERPTTDGSSE